MRKNFESLEFLNSKTLPPAALAFAEKHNIFRSGDASWFYQMVYYRGDINTTEDWIIITNDGGYYKCHASYMMWYLNKNGNQGAQALWRKTSLKNSLESLLNTGETVFDPYYQT